MYFSRRLHSATPSDVRTRPGPFTDAGDRRQEQVSLEQMNSSKSAAVGLIVTKPLFVGSAASFGCRTGAKTLPNHGRDNPARSRFDQGSVSFAGATGIARGSSLPA